MKLTAKTDLDVPISFVYACLADHQFWEREAQGRGIEVRRPADMPPSGPGAGWLLRLPFRGKVVSVLMQLIEAVRDDRQVYDLQSKTIGGSLVLSVMALSPRTTRLNLGVDIGAKTMGARLMLNTMRLAKGRAQARLEARLQQMAAQIQGRFAASQG